MDERITSYNTRLNFNIRGKYLDHIELFSSFDGSGSPNGGEINIMLNQDSKMPAALADYLANKRAVISQNKRRWVIQYEDGNMLPRLKEILIEAHKEGLFSDELLTKFYMGAGIDVRQRE
jgi:hypothetical protein